MVRVVARWLLRRPWILIGDGAYACVLLGWECLSAQATLISRLRLDARLFAPPQPVPAGRRGPKPKKGTALAKLATRVEEALRQGEDLTGRVKSQDRGASQRFSLLTSPQTLTCQRRGPLGEGLTRPVGRNPVAPEWPKSRL